METANLWGVLLAAIGALRWLMEVRNKHVQAAEDKRLKDERDMEALRKENKDLLVSKVNSQLENLKVMVDTLKEDMTALSSQFVIAQKALEVASQKYTETQKKAEAVLVAIKGHVDWTEKRFNKQDSHIMKIDSANVQLGKKLNDLIMVKGKKV